MPAWIRLRTIALSRTILAWYSAFAPVGTASHRSVRYFTPPTSSSCLFFLSRSCRMHEVDRLVFVGEVEDGLEDLLVGVEVEVVGADDLLDGGERVRVAEDAAEDAPLGVPVLRRQAVG